MKNYLVKSVFEVQDTDWKVLNRSHEKDLFANYMAMHEISVASYNKFLQGDWELKFITGQVGQINEAFERTFWAIHDLWHSEPCNILYTDPDTIAIKPVEFWDRYSDFRMFNYTDPRQYTGANPYGRQFANFFNAGVRYFPSTMNSEVWGIGSSMAKSWDTSTYDTEQIILNAMLWDQGITLEQALEPAQAWQLFHPDVNFGNAWNGCSINDARILHLHSSRGAVDRLSFMTQSANQLGFGK
jgi:hypothetical protein